MHRSTFVISALVCLAPTAASLAENWPEFRGPTGQGHYTGKVLPTSWSTTKNVVWKKAIPGRGWSSPIVQDGRVFLTTAVPIKGSKDQSLRALCLDAARGMLLWQTEVFRQDGAKAPPIHSKNSHASPTPVTDGKRLFVHFGHQGTACLDLAGKVIWYNQQLGYAPVHGNGGSPVLVDRRLVFSGDGADKQFVAALNPDSGKVMWKTDRKSEAYKKFSFGTPLVIAIDGKKQIVSPASDAVAAYDPADGKEIWRIKYDGYSLIPRPVYGHGLILLSSGYDRPSMLAIRAGGSGDITDSHIAWTITRGAPHTPSPLLVGDELYMISDSGIASCLDARSGKVHWQERIGGAFSASPFHADGKIYLQSEDGVTTVIRAAVSFERIAQSKLNERTFASYAAADGAIYLRTESKLYRIEEGR
jgi:outer membrane protein assembly factor BamB